jgi:hypothetical protein
MTDILTRLAALTRKDVNKLLPCPFCGKAAEVEEYEGAGHYVYCGNAEDRTETGCPFQPEAKKFYDTKEEAIAAWNSRPREATLIALVQEAAAEIERLRGLVSVIRMKAEWRFQGSDFVAEDDPAYAKVSQGAQAATRYLREILAIANKAFNPQEAS